MNKESAVCAQCPVQCRPENRANSIIEDFQAEELSIKDAKQRVSSMTQEARLLGCPQDEIIRIRRSTLSQIDPKLAEADKRANGLTSFGKREPDLAGAYSRERSFDALRGESYDRYLRSTKGRR